MDLPDAAQGADDAQGTDAQGTGSERGQEEAVRRELEAYYRAGRPPWDSGVTPPELVAVVEGDNALQRGRALELGCGTGTNAVYLAGTAGTSRPSIWSDERSTRRAPRPPQPGQRSGCSAETRAGSKSWTCPAPTTCSSTSAASAGSPRTAATRTPPA